MVSFKMLASGYKCGPGGDENRIADTLPTASQQEDMGLRLSFECTFENTKQKCAHPFLSALAKNKTRKLCHAPILCSYGSSTADTWGKSSVLLHVDHVWSYLSSTRRKEPGAANPVDISGLSKSMESTP